MVNNVTAVSFNFIYQKQWGAIKGVRTGEGGDHRGIVGF